MTSKMENPERLINFSCSRDDYFFASLGIFFAPLRETYSRRVMVHAKARRKAEGAGQF